MKTAVNDTIATIVGHRSVRRFRPDAVPLEAQELIREAMRRGPTSSALQAYTIVFITDAAIRREVAGHAGDQAWVHACPLFIVACVDFRRVQLAAERRGYPYRADDLRALISSTEDVAIAVQNGSLAAQSIDLGTVMIGGVLNGSREIAGILGLPRRVVPLLGLCVGYADGEGGEPHPRLPVEIVFHRNRFELTPEREAQLLAEHDQDLCASGFLVPRRIPFSEIHEGAADPIPDGAYGWTEHVARKQSRSWWLQAGRKLRADLAALGLRLGLFEEP